MGNINDIRVVLGTLRYKSAPETSIGIKLSFEQTFKENVEFDRSIDIDLNRVFNDERQKSSILDQRVSFQFYLKIHIQAQQIIPHLRIIYIMLMRLSRQNNNVRLLLKMLVGRDSLNIVSLILYVMITMFRVILNHPIII